MKEHFQNITAYGKDYVYLEKLAKTDEKICIYGCGVNGEILCEYLKHNGKDIECFIDKQAETRTFYVLGKMVVSLDYYKLHYKNCKIIISQDDQDNIIQYLRDSEIEKDNIISPFLSVTKKIRLFDNDYDPETYIFDNRENCILNLSDEKPKATIFTILYNTPSGMLCRTIESVLNQSFRNFNYLIIDNGSTDSSSEIINKYAKYDHRIKYIRLKKNVPWANRDLQITLRDNIETDYVAMVDSDDYYESDFLEKALNIAQKDKADIVQVNTLTYAHEGFRYSYFAQHMGKDILVEKEQKDQYLLLRMINTPTWGKLIRSSLLVELINMMQSYENEHERDRCFCLDISWVAYLTMASKRVSLCDELLHVRTWRPGSSEHSDDHGPKWLSSMVWSFKHLDACNVDNCCRDVYEDTALNWLFSLNRETYNLNNFNEEDISYAAVQRFLSRPICDKYRSN